MPPRNESRFFLQELIRSGLCEMDLEQGALLLKTLGWHGEQVEFTSPDDPTQPECVVAWIRSNWCSDCRILTKNGWKYSSSRPVSEWKVIIARSIP